MLSNGSIFLALVLSVALMPSDLDAQDLKRGREIALLVCTSCHVVEPDQKYTVILRPPAPPFESIAQRPSTTAESIRKHLKTTHRDAENPNGMPNPQLIDSYIEQVTAYLLSLRNNR